MLTVGSEAARRRLPELLDRAHGGEASVIEKRGKPYAALVPLSGSDAAPSNSQGESLLALRASGEGLWGDDIASTLRGYRDEWA